MPVRSIPAAWAGLPPPSSSILRRIRLAVIAHIRHKHTKYDKLLMRHDDRQLARGEVRPTIENVLCRWKGVE